MELTAFADSPYEITARLVVRRVLDANTQDPLFPVWRYHPFFTNNTEPVDQADITHRDHAICEQVWADLIDGPWAHQPSGSFAANAAWTVLAAITHNLLRAAGTITGTARYAVARGATLREHIINVPARLARPQRRPMLHLPRHWPRARARPWQSLWTAVFATQSRAHHGTNTRSAQRPAPHPTATRTEKAGAHRPADPTRLNQGRSRIIDKIPLNAPSPRDGAKAGDSDRERSNGFLSR